MRGLSVCLALASFTAIGCGGSSGSNDPVPDEFGTVDKERLEREVRAALSGQASTSTLDALARWDAETAAFMSDWDWSTSAQEALGDRRFVDALRSLAPVALEPSAVQWGHGDRSWRPQGECPPEPEMPIIAAGAEYVFFDTESALQAIAAGGSVICKNMSQSSLDVEEVARACAAAVAHEMELNLKLVEDPITFEDATPGALDRALAEYHRAVEEWKACIEQDDSLLQEACANICICCDGPFCDSPAQCEADCLAEGRGALTDECLACIAGATCSDLALLYDSDAGSCGGGLCALQ